MFKSRPKNKTTLTKIRFNRYTTNIYQIWGFYSLVMRKYKTSIIHFYTSWFYKDICISLLPGDLASTEKLQNHPFLLSSSMHFSPPHIHIHLAETVPERGPFALLQLSWRLGTGNPAPCRPPRFPHMPGCEPQQSAPAKKPSHVH